MSMWGAVLALGAGCTRQKEARVEPVCIGDSARLRGVLVDARSSEPLPDALLAVERDGLYGANPDPTRANPAYVHGARTDAQGRFDVTLPCGTVGLHAFAPGHRCGAAVSEVGDALLLSATSLTARDLAPVLSQASLRPAKVAPGGEVTVQVTAMAGGASDPLSDQVLAIAPELKTGLALDPPGLLPGGYADGVWRRTFTAPSAPGTYTWHLVAASEACVPSAPLALTLTVE
jgi:hypothetical protein